MNLGFGKVILLGEHAVVFGKSAIACGISRGVRAQAVKAKHFSLNIDPWKMHIELGTSSTPQSTQQSTLAHAFSQLVQSYEITDTPLAISLTVELEAGAGLGCSAAMAVAIARAICDALALESDHESIQRHAMAWEKVFHGNPSGVDTAAATHGGVLFFSADKKIQTLTLKQSFYLVVAHSGQPSLTKDMVTSVKHQHERDLKRVNAVMNGIESLVHHAKQAIEQGNLPELGKSMSLNHGLLSSLLLSTPKIERMHERAIAAGALGAKLTGAGGGGCMIALCPNKNQAEEVKQALLELSSSCFIEAIHANS